MNKWPSIRFPIKFFVRLVYEYSIVYKCTPIPHIKGTRIETCEVKSTVTPKSFDAETMIGIHQANLDLHQWLADVETCSLRKHVYLSTAFAKPDLVVVRKLESYDVVVVLVWRFESLVGCEALDTLQLWEVDHCYILGRRGGGVWCLMWKLWWYFVTISEQCKGSSQHAGSSFKE